MHTRLLTRSSFLGSLALGAAIFATALLVACGGDDDGSTPQATTAAQPTAAAQATTAPTARPVAVTLAMLNVMGIGANEVSGLFGSTAFAQNRTNIADIPSAFASSPELGAFLNSQTVQGIYNAWTATGPCVVCAVQVPVMIFPNEQAATMGYGEVRRVNQQVVFQNVMPIAGFSSYWNDSFCQTATFTSQAGQTTNWVFCAARKGNGMMTVAVGGLNFNAGQVGDAVRAYATRIENYLKTQFP